jgi:hypothetical protein
MRRRHKNRKPRLYRGAPPARPNATRQGIARQDVYCARCGQKKARCGCP